jgi:hypothetical protein
VINFESYKGLFARVQIFMHKYTFICLKGRFDRLFHTSLALLCLISCGGSLFSLLDT